MKQKTFLSTAALKYIAVLTMLVDHLGAAFFCIYTSVYDGTEAFAGADIIYKCMRTIGRTSFPIFCFVLVEGFVHTHNLKKYLARLFVFTLISEIPFDLAFRSKIWDVGSQNVFFTLFIGMLAIATIRSVMQLNKWDIYFKLPLCVLTSIIYIWIAYFLKTDYSSLGVLLIIVFYIFRNERWVACLVGYVCMIWEYWCFPAFLVVLFYNGKKGKENRWFFYLFYPVHLILLYVLRQLVLK